MFASDYRDDFAEESEDLYEEDNYRSDFESMLSANNSIDDQLKVNYNKDFTEEQGGAQGYEDDFYNESQQGSSVVKSANNIQEFSSVTFYQKTSPGKDGPEVGKPVKKKVKRKQTPKETKPTPAQNKSEGIRKPNTSERKSTPRSNTPKDIPSNNNNDNNENGADIQYHKYKRYEVHTPQMTDINTRTVIPITSHVVKDLRHNSFSIQRQLDLALKKIETYKNENSILRSKLDSSGIESAVERYKSALLEKEIIITQLQEENKGLKMVARHQSKGLMKSDHDRQHQPERELSQDRQIEILMEHIKKLKIKLEDYKVMEKQFTEENRTLKAQNGKLTRRVTKLKRQITDLTNGPHRSPTNKPDLLDMINEDLSREGSSLVESSYKIQESLVDNETVSTYPSIALTEDSRKQMIMLPFKAAHSPARFTQQQQQQQQEEQLQKRGETSPQQQQQMQEDLNLRRDDDDVSIPLDDDEVGELNSQSRYSSGLAVNNVSSITASQAVNPGIAGGLVVASGVSQEYSRGFDRSRVDSESTFSVDTNTNPRRLRRRREYNQRIQELLLQVEEEKLYVLRQKELILKLEKSSSKQRHGYIAEINALKTELTKCEEDRKQVTSELNKRELKLKMQTLTLRQLKIAYDELLEGHKQLLATKDTLEKAGMTNPIPTLKSLLIKAHPPAETIIEPRPPTVTRPSSTGNLRPTARAAKIVDSDENDEENVVAGQEMGGNLTLMTSEVES